MVKFVTAIKDLVVRFLKFLRLVGEDQHVDWTTVALVASLFVLVFKVQNPGLPEIGAFFLALGARAHKKHLGSKAQGEVAKQIEDYKAEADKAIKDIGEKATAAHTALNDIRVRYGLESLNPWTNR